MKRISIFSGRFEITINLKSMNGSNGATILSKQNNSDLPNYDLITLTIQYKI